MTEAFVLEELKEYWCIISLNDDKDDPRVLRVSPDTQIDNQMSFCNGIPCDDTPIDQAWIDIWVEQETTISGVYKLVLEPEHIDDKAEETRFSYFNVTKVEPLYTLEPLPIEPATP